MDYIEGAGATVNISLVDPDVNTLNGYVISHGSGAPVSTPSGPGIYCDDDTGKYYVWNEDTSAWDLLAAEAGGLDETVARDLIVTRDLTVGRTVIETGRQTPSALAAGETVLLTPAAPSRVLVLSASGVAFLDSLAAGTDGEVRWIENDGSYTIALGHEEGTGYGGATAANCFNCPDAIPYVLRPGARVPVEYRGSRWRVRGVNTFAPGGRLCPATIAEFLERTAFTPTYLYPCDEMGVATGQVLHEVGTANLTIAGAPLVDWRMGGYRGVQVTDAANGWRGDIAAPATNSILEGTFFGQAAHAGGDNWISGWIDTAGDRLALIVDAADDKVRYSAYDGTHLAVAVPNKTVIDGVVRLGQGQLDTTAVTIGCRVSGRGEAAVSASAASTGMGSLTGLGKTNFVGGALSGSGSTQVTFIGGYFRIVGAGGEGAATMAKIAHRLGME